MDSSLKAVDALLADAGLDHGRRRVLSIPGYLPEARRARMEAPEREPREPRRTGLHLLAAPSLAGMPHGFSTRTGGVSTAYGCKDDLNLSFNASDEPAHVEQNQARLLRRWGQASLFRTLKQTHSTVIHRVGCDEAALTGDGLMTDEPGVALGILTADCVPVLVADRRTGAVAAFHAGWRGTLRRIVEQGIGRMRMEFGSRPEDMSAAVGPAIGACCYGVGEEVEHEFRSQFHYAGGLFREAYDADPIRKKYPMLFLTQRAPGHSDLGPALHLDLQEANRRQLLDAGLAPARVSIVKHCTSCRTDMFFSYRAEGGFTGRMLSVVAAAG